MALFDLVLEFIADGPLADNRRLVRPISSVGLRGGFLARTVGALRVLRLSSLPLRAGKCIRLRNLPRSEGSYRINSWFAGNVRCLCGIQQASPQTWRTVIRVYGGSSAATGSGRAFQ